MIYEWFQHIEFANTWVLPSLGMLPVFAWLHYRTAATRKSSLTVSSVRGFKERTARTALVHLPFWLRLVAMGCIILALARPQARNVQTQMKGEGIDIVLCLDVSGSMRSRDFYPDRLEVAKEMAADFVKARPVDQIGLVIFSGEPFTQYPLTTDHPGLVEQIRNLRSGMLEDGTVIGEGLATSVNRLVTSKAKSKVIILLTDGKEEPPETRLIDPYTALEIAKAERVKVYTIGMMAQASATVQEGRGSGGSTAFLDESLLRRIAAQTGGEYFRATDKEGLQQVYRQIDRLEKTDVDVVSKTRFEERFMPFMIAALLLLALEVILRYSLLRTFP